MNRFVSNAALALAGIVSLLVACGTESRNDDRTSTSGSDGGGKVTIPQTVAAKCISSDGGSDSDGGTVGEVNDAGELCTCPAGYTLEGRLCRFVDFCKLSPNGGCDTNATCTPEINGRICKCNSGYEGDGETCTQGDPCRTNNGGCDPLAKCTRGSESNVICKCRFGYEGDGRTCKKVTSKYYMECTAWADCDSGQICLPYSTPGLGVCLQRCTSDSQCPQHMGTSRCNLPVDTYKVCTVVCENGASECPPTASCTTYSGTKMCLP